MNVEPLLHVSALIYSHLQAATKCNTRRIRRKHTTLSVVNGKIENNNNFFNAFHTVVLDKSAYFIQPSNTTNAES